MCKYCKFTYVDEEIGERSNKVKRITKIRYDDHRFIEVQLYRYRVDDGSYSNNALILDDVIKLKDGLHTVEEHPIKINYCPFCGEKL